MQLQTNNAIHHLHIYHRRPSCFMSRSNHRAAIGRIELPLRSAPRLDLDGRRLPAIRTVQRQEHRHLRERRGAICIQQQLLACQLLHQPARGFLDRGRTSLLPSICSSTPLSVPAAFP